MKLSRIITTSLFTLITLVYLTTGCLTNKPNSNIPDSIWKDQDPYWRNPIIPHYEGKFNYSPITSEDIKNLYK